MSAAGWTRSVTGVVDRWLTRPEVNAAGRLGLFRVLFALFYLWHLSPQVIANLSGLTERHHHRTLLVEWARPYALPAEVLQAVESGLVAALVLLLVGYRTQLATLAVLVLGSLYEAWLITVDVEHATVFLAFYVPLFMLLSGRWGDTYSLDAHLRRRAGLPVTDPSDDSGRFFLPARAVLVVLVLLFCSAAAFKILETWLQRPDLLANILLDRNIKAAVRELPLNPLAPFIAERPWLSIPLQGFVIVFEGLFILALFGKRLRDLILSSALIFQAVNGLWLMVTFTPLLIVYALFVDLEQVRRRVLPRRLAVVDRLPAALLSGERSLRRWPRVYRGTPARRCDRSRARAASSTGAPSGTPSCRSRRGGGCGRPPDSSPASAPAWHACPAAARPVRYRAE